MTKRVSLPVLDDTPTTRPSSSLPEIAEVNLDWNGVDCVLADLDDFTEIREMLGRRAKGEPIAETDIVIARDRFVRGDYHGLQITYAFADEVWIDTLLREATGARLLRMAAPTRP